VRNNIVTNTIDSPVITNDGYGINNRLGSNYKFVLENNVVWNNENGNYNNVGSHDTDMNADPLFADPANHDYHLKSAEGRWSGNGWITDTVTSPLIDAGNPTSDCGNEPDPNGGKINIGRYGNTAEASRSGSSLSEEVPDNATTETGNRSPIITLFTPSDAEVFEQGSTVNVSVGAIDAEDDTLSYKIAIDGSEVSDSAAYEWNLGDSSAGSHTIEATVSDGVNNVTSSHVVSVAEK